MKTYYTSRDFLIIIFDGKPQQILEQLKDGFA